MIKIILSRLLRNFKNYIFVTVSRVYHPLPQTLTQLFKNITKSVYQNQQLPNLNILNLTYYLNLG
jgi:hypothetical protein